MLSTRGHSRRVFFGWKAPVVRTSTRRPEDKHTSSRRKAGVVRRTSARRPEDKHTSSRRKAGVVQRRCVRAGRGASVPDEERQCGTTSVTAKKNGGGHPVRDARHRRVVPGGSNELEWLD